jgi:hypothetical protein
VRTKIDMRLIQCFSQYTVIQNWEMEMEISNIKTWVYLKIERALKERFHWKELCGGYFIQSKFKTHCH